MAAQKVSGPGTDGDSGAGLALHHCSLDTYGGHGMVQQHPVLPLFGLGSSRNIKMNISLH
jgi:hypothetical protein